MSLYDAYLEEIEERKSQDLDPQPIDNAELLGEIITQIKDLNNKHRKESFSSNLISRISMGSKSKI